jgi:hypothetical protein
MTGGALLVWKHECAKEAEMAEKEQGPKPVTIIVNTRAVAWNDKNITFEELVSLAYPGQMLTEGDSVTVRYSRGHDGHGNGTLTAGETVTLKDGMVFDAVRTSRS